MAWLYKWHQIDSSALDVGAVVGAVFRVSVFMVNYMLVAFALCNDNCWHYLLLLSLWQVKC